MSLLDGVYYVQTNSSMPCGYLKFENNSLQFYKYKQIEGRYDIVSYIVVKIIEMFRKEKLMVSAPKDAIKSLKIEKGEEYTGFGSRAINMFGGTTKSPDCFVVTTNDGEYKFMLRTDKEDRDSSEFNSFVSSMGMFLS